MKKRVWLYMLAVIMLLASACSTERKTESMETGSTNAQVTENGGSGDEIDTIRVGSSFSYYPFGYMDGEQKAGFEVEVWKEIGKRAGLKVEHVQSAFSGLFGMLDKGELDTIANQISKNPEREEKYNFSVPYCYNPLKLVVPKGNLENINGLDDMIGKRLMYGTGGIETSILKEQYPDDPFEIVQVETGELMQLLSGKASAVIRGVAAAAIEIKDNNLDLEIVGDTIYLEENAYAFAKNERGDVLLAKVNEALEEMHADGTLTKLATEWFGYDISKQN